MKLKKGQHVVFFDPSTDEIIEFLIYKDVGFFMSNGKYVVTLFSEPKLGGLEYIGEV
jgi:hypothetical protein